MKDSPALENIAMGILDNSVSAFIALTNSNPPNRGIKLSVKIISGRGAPLRTASLNLSKANSPSAANLTMLKRLELSAAIFAIAR